MSARSPCDCRTKLLSRGVRLSGPPTRRFRFRAHRRFPKVRRRTGGAPRGGLTDAGECTTRRRRRRRRGPARRRIEHIRCATGLATFTIEPPCRFPAAGKQMLIGRGTSTRAASVVTLRTTALLEVVMGGTEWRFGFGHLTVLATTAASHGRELVPQSTLYPASRWHRRTVPHLPLQLLDKDVPFLFLASTGSGLQLIVFVVHS